MTKRSKAPESPAGATRPDIDPLQLLKVLAMSFVLIFVLVNVIIDPKGVSRAIDEACVDGGDSTALSTICADGNRILMRRDTK